MTVQKQTAEEKILELFHQSPSRSISGEQIGRLLGISRTAVWKRIQHLRRLGYEIESSTRAGYRLIRSPDLLIPFEIKPNLQTRWMGKRIHYFRAIDSTNSKAYELALKGAKEGEIVVAESQKRGRGRLGRKWFSPPYLNLYLSVILRPKIPPHQASLITLMAAVATAEGIEKYSGLKPLIKWPNDILLGNRKLAGLLNEIRSEGDRIEFIILGIGINLNMGEGQFPEEIRPLATSLKIEKGEPISRKAFLQTLLKELEEWYEIFLREGGERILKAWKERSKIKGRRIRVTSFGQSLTGEAVDVDSEGALILRMKKGERRRIVAGDIEYLE